MCTERPAKGYTNRCQPSRLFMLSMTRVSLVGSADQRHWISISGRIASISGLS